VSVILPVRNEERHIEACLASVRGQDYSGGPMEILVADGRSEDRTRAIVARIAEEDPRVRLVDNPGGIVPTAMNAAIREARGRFVVRVDGHATIPPDYVTSVLRAFRESGADCVGGAMAADAEGYWGRVIAHATSHPFGVGGSRFHYADTASEVDTVYLGAYERSRLLELGLYDERFVRNQDDELNYRLRSTGGRVWFDPRIRASYVNRGSLRKLFSQYRQYGYWKVWMYRKHVGLFQPRHAVPAAFVLAVLLGAAAAVGRPGTGIPSLAGLLGLHVSCGWIAGLAARWPLPVTVSAPVAFLTMHLAYGIGSLHGLGALLARRGVVPRRPRVDAGTSPEDSHERP
jgi:glycosyltransferase involved in cell wall biosynthesis